MKTLLSLIQDNPDCKIIGFTNDRNNSLNGSCKSLLLYSYAEMLGGSLYKTLRDDFYDEDIDRAAIVDLVSTVISERVQVVVVLSTRDISQDDDEVNSLVRLLLVNGCRLFSIETGSFYGEGSVNLAKDIMSEIKKVCDD